MQPTQWPLVGGIALNRPVSAGQAKWLDRVHNSVPLSVGNIGKTDSGSLTLNPFLTGKVSQSVKTRLPKRPASPFLDRSWPAPVRPRSSRSGRQRPQSIFRRPLDWNPFSRSRRLWGRAARVPPGLEKRSLSGFPEKKTPGRLPCRAREFSRCQDFPSGSPTIRCFFGGCRSATRRKPSGGATSAGTVRTTHQITSFSWKTIPKRRLDSRQTASPGPFRSMPLREGHSLSQFSSQVRKIQSQSFFRCQFPPIQWQKQRI